MYYYLNEDKTYRKCDLMEWSTQFEGMSKQGVRHVASDMINEYHVSTVWLGMDHNHFGKGKPLLFETMVFDSAGHDIYMNRYTTWDEAAIGHEEAMNWVKQRGKA